MFSAKNIILITVFLYLLFMLYIGIYSNNKSIKTSDDYLVAGRRLPWWLLVGTLAATEIGAGSTMGVTQKAYNEWGLGAAWYIWTMAISFMVVAFIAPKLRRTEVRTIPEFFLQKYGKVNHIITSIIMIVPLIGLTAVQMIATATIFSTITGMDYFTSAVISCGIVILYTILGGSWSVSLTDFYQWILIVLGMGITLLFVIAKIGGWHELISYIPANKLSLVDGIGWKTIISLIIMYTTSMLVGQEVTQRLYSGKNEKHVFWGSFVTAMFYFLFALIPPILGLSIYALESKGVIPRELIGGFSDMYVLPALAIHTLPPLITGLLFVGLISATMSSASSDLLGAASIFTNDIWVQYFKKNTMDQTKVLITRVLVGIVGVIALIIALFNSKDIIVLLMFSFSLRSAGGFFPYILGHYWEKITPLATLLSLIIPSIIVLYLEITKIKIWGLEPIIPALLVSFFIIVFCSWQVFPWTKCPKNSI